MGHRAVQGDQEWEGRADLGSSATETASDGITARLDQEGRAARADQADHQPVMDRRIGRTRGSAADLYPISQRREELLAGTALVGQAVWAETYPQAGGGGGVVEWAAEVKDEAADRVWA